MSDVAAAVNNIAFLLPIPPLLLLLFPLLLGGGWFPHVRTHESLDRTLLTSNDAEREKNDAKGDNINSTGRKRISYNAAAISCGIRFFLVLHSQGPRSWKYRQDRILDLWDFFLPSRLFGCLPRCWRLVPGVTVVPGNMYTQGACFYPCTNKSLNRTRTHQHHIRSTSRP